MPPARSFVYDRVPIQPANRSSLASRWDNGTDPMDVATGPPCHSW